MKRNHFAVWGSQRRTWVAWAIAAVFCLSLASCQGPDTAGGETTGTPVTPDQAFATYLAAAEVTTQSDSWSETMDMTAAVEATRGNTRTKTTVTMNSQAEITRYSEEDATDLALTGSGNMAVLGETYAWEVDYRNGTAHYTFTQPVQREQDVEISPNCFLFDALTVDMITAADSDGNQLHLTLDGGKVSQSSLSVLNLLGDIEGMGNLVSGMENLQYSDVDLVVTTGEGGGITNLAMVFHASVTYQGYDQEMNYDIQYGFQPLEVPVVTEEGGASSPEEVANQFVDAMVSLTLGDSSNIVELIPAAVINAMAEEEGVDREEVKEALAESWEEAFLEGLDNETLKQDIQDVSYEIVNTRDMTEEKLQEVKETFRGIGFNISEGKWVTIEYTYQGDETGRSSTMDIPALKNGNFWYLGAGVE